MYRALYRLLARLDAETIHDGVVAGLRTAGKAPPLRAALRALCGVPADDALAVTAFGVRFAHPLGLAGGFDKHADMLHAAAALGFAHIEVGTVTPRPQPGNPRPRIFRLPEDGALINRMGFPGAGVEALTKRLERRPAGLPAWVSLGKNKDTPLGDAGRDYTLLLERLYPHADAFTINISSPNTPELRRLQTREYLSDLLAGLRETAARLAGNAPPKPLLVKIAPDLDWAEIETVAELALQHGLAGIVATNTTLARDGLRGPARGETGGLSGKPLRARSTEIIRHLRGGCGDRLTLVGVGGVFDGDDIWDKLAAGASLVQAYTGFIYEGPTFARKALRGLKRRMQAEGVASLAEMVGR
ncbi:MAG: quinone-dependent dihydroorotate dehydrogenase [Anaerolineae bacterium]|nr:quinone-dependent dihydroorotate dehydrogenase [Anaerolineae bacterium]